MRQNYVIVFNKLNKKIILFFSTFKSTEKKLLINIKIMRYFLI